MVQHGADGTVPRRTSVALVSSVSESWGYHADAVELARHALKTLELVRSCSHGSVLTNPVRCEIAHDFVAVDECPT